MMNKFMYLCLAMLTGAGCGGSNEQHEKEVEKLKNRLRHCENTIDSSLENERQLRMEMTPDEAQQAPSPPYVAPWHRTFKSMVEETHEAMEGEDYTIRFRNGALVLAVPVVSVFEAGAKKPSEDGRTTIKAIAGLLKRHHTRRNIGVTVRTVDHPKAEEGEGSGNSASFNRAKSVDTALAIVSLLEDEGIDAANIITIGYGLEPDDVTLVNKSAVEIIIYPMGEEIPKYPNLK